MSGAARGQRDPRDDSPALQASGQDTTELERSILGACLGSLDNCIDLLGVPVEHFSRQEHRELCQALKTLGEEGREPDLAVVQEVLRKAGGEMAYSDLARFTLEGLSVHLGSRLELLAEAHLRRRIWQAAVRTLDDLAEESLAGEEIISKTLSRLTDLSLPVEVAAPDIWTVMNELCREGLAGQTVEHFPTGLGGLDGLLCGGLTRGTLTVLGGRTSMGKSALAAQVAMNVSKQGRTVLYFSPEMSARTLARRFLGPACGVEPSALRLGMSPKWWEATSVSLRDTFAGLRFFVCDDASLTSGRAVSLSHRVKRTKGLDLVVVDYLQRLGDLPLPHENQNLLVGRLSRSFQALARQLDCAVILVSQLNRQPEARHGGKPKLSDLRDSGVIEQDADIVLLIHRPNFGAEGKDWDDATLFLAKNRDGATGTIKARWDPARMRFLALASDIS